MLGSGCNNASKMCNCTGGLTPRALDEYVTSILPRQRESVVFFFKIFHTAPHTRGRERDWAPSMRVGLECATSSAAIPPRALWAPIVLRQQNRKKRSLGVRANITCYAFSWSISKLKHFGFCFGCRFFIVKDFVTFCY